MKSSERLKNISRNEGNNFISDFFFDEVMHGTGKRNGIVLAHVRFPLPRPFVRSPFGKKLCWNAANRGD